MLVYQRDIVEVSFLLPDKTVKPHPALVVSNDEVFMRENMFYGLLISSKSYEDDFEYEIHNEMVTKSLTKKSYIKCHMIQGFQTNQIIAKHGAMKKIYFDKLLEHFFNSVFKNQITIP